jgi:TonB-linked SusC/RagA family outer membrane protein
LAPVDYTGTGFDFILHYHKPTKLKFSNLKLLLMKRLAFLLFLIALSCGTLLAQIEVTGTVTSAEDGSPLPGVAVVLKGTTVGAITDVDGHYSIEVPNTEAVLMFAFVGMVTVERQVGDQMTIDVVLEQDVFGLDEVVVTGYATQVRANLTGAISTVASDELEKTPETTLLKRMQGTVTGVTITSDHHPGGNVDILVRGLGTINDNTPLFVIDGVPTSTITSTINANDVESITVLKDAASQAIYGARGANGVILVTTKRGTRTKPEVRFSARVGNSRATGYYDLLNTEEYGQLLWLEAANDGVVGYSHQLYGDGAEPDIPDYILPARATPGSPAVSMDRYNIDESVGPLYLIMKANKEGTDWYDAILRTAPLQEYDLSISGGAENASYFFSAGYMSEEGILKYTGFDRYSFRSNADATLARWLNVGQTLGVTYTHGYGNRGDNSEASVISQAYRMQPIIPIYDEAGNWGGTRAPGTGNGANPLAILTRDQNDYDNGIRALGNVFAEATIIEGLTFKTLFGYDYRAGWDKDITIKNPEFAEAIENHSLSEGDNWTLQWNWQNLLTFNRTFAGMHNLNVLLGTEAVSSTYRWKDASRQVYFSTDPNYMFLSSGETTQQNSGLGSDWRTMSYFGRLDYDFAGKYLLEATLRRDGSSRFGANQRYGMFPAFSVGWRITEESFMAGTEGWLNYLKLRAGWGQAGNDRIGDYNGFTTFHTAIDMSYYSLTGDNTSTVAGFEANAFGNPDARWESTTTINVGLDANFLTNRLSVVFDLWQRNTSDMLYELSKPAVEGVADIPSVNIGDMTNNGFDVNVIWRDVKGDFRYTINANLSHYKNEIVKLSDNPDEIITGGDLRQMVYCRAELGTAFPEFYGYNVLGFFETQAEADEYPPAFGADGTYNKPGHFKMEDVNGDGVIDADDRIYIGSPHPDFTAGLTLNLGYGPFDLDAFFYSSYGNELVNYVSRWIDYTQFGGNRSHDRLYRSWGSPYLEGEPILAIADTDQGSQEPSSHFVQDGSYLRLKTLTLSYTLPQSLLNTLKMKNLQIFLQGTNLFTLTKYRGLDPEVKLPDDEDQSALGIDQGAWPTPRQFLFGVRVGI